MEIVLYVMFIYLHTDSHIFGANISHDKKKGYCVILGKVPELSVEAISGVRMFLKNKKKWSGKQSQMFFNSRTC